MKTAPAVTEPAPQPDLELAGGCLACGGVLSIRVRPGSARSVCRTCGAWSSPHLAQDEEGLHVRQTIGGAA